MCCKSLSGIIGVCLRGTRLVCLTLMCSDQHLVGLYIQHKYLIFAPSYMPPLLILALINLFPDVVTYGTLAVGTWVRIMRSGCLRTSPKKSKLRLPTRSTLATAQAGAPVFNLYALRLYTSDCTGGRCYLPPQCCVPAISP